MTTGWQEGLSLGLMRVESPDDLAVNTSRLPQTITEVKKYSPSIDERVSRRTTVFAQNWAQGAVMQGKGFVDFVIRKEDGYTG